MRFFDADHFPLKGLPLQATVKTWRLRTKLLVALIPSVVFILALTGFATILFSDKFLDEALQRPARIQALGLAHELDVFLNRCREDLLILAQKPIAAPEMIGFVTSRKLIGGIAYKEVGFVSNTGADHIFYVYQGEAFVRIPSGQVAMVQPNPLAMLDQLDQLRSGDVWISDVVDVGYPDGGAVGSKREWMSSRVIRFATPWFGEDKTLDGMLILSIELYQLREILSVFNSPESPIFAYPRTPEPRYNFFFDKSGWILFESEALDDQEKELSTGKVRQDFSGLAGRPGLECAFRPDSMHAQFWQMVKEIGSGKHGLIVKADDTGRGKETLTSEFFVAYAPIRFKSALDQDAVVYAGVAFVDRSRLPLSAGYQHINVMFVITIVSIIIISLVIFGLSRTITGPIVRLASAVSNAKETGKLEEIVLPDHDDETSGLRNAVNQMIVTLRNQIEEIRIKDQRLERESQREKARLEEEVEALRKRLGSHAIEEIVGIGPSVDALKSDIIKAASVDADVLIIGETGTGKQLTAEAIHKHSRRSEKPFISINCGALDENLLLDTLFGHVKGAFTEAKADRKGAFVAASGGTLFLDEIGTATARVQQALLRALSLRKIKPLGSDAETSVDLRVITASNEDLMKLIAKGLFRQDLYYRLEVLTIRTPSLRDHKENIPVLVSYFLKQAARLMNREDIGIAKGALEKMKNYHWPGNVRELMNCVTRSVAMVEGKLIQAEDIYLGGQPQPLRLQTETLNNEESVARETKWETELVIPPDLNLRQRRAMPFIFQKGEITRAQYQEIVGDIPSRTALYDLQDLTEKGLLKRIGRGPATRYHLAKLLDSAR